MGPIVLKCAIETAVLNFDSYISSFEFFDISPPVHTYARERLRKEGFLEIQRENKQREIQEVHYLENHCEIEA